MGPAYLIVAGHGEAFEAVAAGLRDDRWIEVASCGAARVWIPAGASSPVLAAAPQALILGRSFHPAGPRSRLQLLAAGCGQAVITRLLHDGWGEYVALVEDPHDGLLLLRDPSGGVEALTWRTREGVAVAAPDLRDAPRWLRPQRLSLDWDRIAGFLNATSANASASLFDDIAALPPGGLARLGDPKSCRLAWRPAAFVADPITDLAGAEAELVRRVDLATAGLVQGHARLLCEVSGGLDSAIVAASLAATGSAQRVATWYNAVSDRRDGDEMAYARAVTDRLQVTPTFYAKPIAPLQVADFEELAGGFRPATAGVDAAGDRDLASRIRNAGATAVVAGQGGDAAFYQMPSNYLVSDLLRQGGLRVFGDPRLAAMARRRRKSVWGALAEAWAERRLTAQPPRTNKMLTRAAAAVAPQARHPWEADSLDLPLSKQLHVRGLAQAHATRGDSRRTQVAPLLCPLMAQPVIEWVLAIPAVDLAVGVQDRPLARRAFADRLPEAIRARRSKGELTAYFARVMALSADALRPYLLDGNLVSAGVLDRQAIAQALDPDQLIHAPHPSELLMAAATEAWVRHWQAQVPDAPGRGPWRR